jgi:hypothetical protein
MSLFKSNYYSYNPMAFQCMGSFLVKSGHLSFMANGSKLIDKKLWFSLVENVKCKSGMWKMYLHKIHSPFPRTGPSMMNDKYLLCREDVNPKTFNFELNYGLLDKMNLREHTLMLADPVYAKFLAEAKKTDNWLTPFTEDSSCLHNHSCFQSFSLFYGHWELLASRLNSKPHGYGSYQNDFFVLKPDMGPSRAP